MKLFGNKNALLKEKLRQKAVGKWVIHPCSNFRLELSFYLILLGAAFVLILVCFFLVMCSSRNLPFKAQWRQMVTF